MAGEDVFMTQSVRFLCNSASATLHAETLGKGTTTSCSRKACAVFNYNEHTESPVLMSHANGDYCSEITPGQ